MLLLLARDFKQFCHIDFLYKNFMPTSFLLSVLDYGDKLLLDSLASCFGLHRKQPFSIGIHNCNCSLCGLSLSYKHNCYQCFFLNLSSFSPTSLIATFTSISAGQIIHMCQEPSIQRILHQDSSWEQVKAWCYFVRHEM